MGHFFTWLAGADSEILGRIRTDRAKYVSIGAVILLTGVLACVSMSFALHTVLKVALPAAIPFAVGWGIAIMTLDRALVVSLRPGSGPLKYAALVLFRLLIAAVMGFVVSTPFTLQVFRPEIDAQVLVIQAHNQAAFHPGVDSEFNRWQKEVTTDNGVIKSHGVTEPGVASLQNRLTHDEKNRDIAFGAWWCQRYGPHCPAGPGPLELESRKKYEQARDLVKREQKDLSNAKDSAVSQAEGDLPNSQRKLDDARSLRTREIAAFNRANSADSGLLIRLQALENLVRHSFILNAARWLLFSLFALFEVMPVLVKILMNAGRVTSYEQALRAEDAALLAISRQMTDAYRDERVKLIPDIVPEVARQDAWPAQARRAGRQAPGAAGSIGIPDSARPLASAGAAALVRIMATEGWPAVRNAAAGLWTRYQPPYLADRVVADLDAANATVARARQTGDRRAEGAVAAEWEGRILALLTLQPTAAADVGEITAAARPSASTGRAAAGPRDWRPAASRTLR